MHPIFKGGRIGLYLLAWLPIAATLAALLAAQARLGWLPGIAISIPLCLIYAMVCLGSWYPCRAHPLRGGTFTDIAVTHLVAAAALAGLWTGLTKLVFLALSFAASADAVLPMIFGLGVLLYLLAVAVNYMFLSVEASRLAEAREAEARLLAGEAELRALKAQINPHFLFNSLHSISALTSVDGAKAREMCVLLSAFLRSTLGLSDKTEIRLEEELAMIQSYLAIEKIRFGSRLNFEEEIDPATTSEPVPPLLLQPLVENAVIHGIANCVEAGFIRICVHRNAGNGIVIAIENSFDSDAPASNRGGFGLAAVRKRLQARYGAEAQLSAGPLTDTYRVEVHLPAQEDARP
jgi:hypothetical protein